jgi:hypothetical protein
MMQIGFSIAIREIGDLAKAKKNSIDSFCSPLATFSGNQREPLTAR